VAQIAAAYFSTTSVRPDEIPQVLNAIWRGVERDDHGTAQSAVTAEAEGAGAAQEASAATSAPASPSAAEIRGSITPDALISFEDRKPYKTLKRHLASRGLTPDEYRAKWNLPDDYPMVAANYSAVRAATARRTNLGLLGQQARSRRRSQPDFGA
jgi:predicted transcriptional regulator